MAKNLVLHIGVPKLGTTAMQNRLFYKLSQVLKDKNINIQVIIPLRNQANLLYSLYVHWYAYLVKENCKGCAENYIKGYIEKIKGRDELIYFLWH